LKPIEAFDRPDGHTLGFALCLLGLTATFGAQVAMGDSWRIGVDPKESTELVTGGPFRIVRNPIYSAMIPTCLGFVLLVPNALAVAAWIALVVGLELHVRGVEEPYLLRVHGRAYSEYAARVGRFLPGMGRLAP
jgi:protein-S-isoprenylcysteine O-methyltransferase Ste14